jgi:ABC-type cobalamin/Fe3+-siderophores transport system ATPase subunit
MLEAQDLSLTRAGGKVLDAVSMAVRPGVLLAIVGPNGAGKSSLLACLAGLEKPASGRVRLQGHDLTDFRRRDLARRLAYLPQESDGRFGFTVLQAALMGRNPHLGRLDPYSPRDRELALRALAAMDMEHLAERPLTALSGGEKRRAALARILAQDASVLLLDEPTAGLDIRHTLGLMRLLRGLAESRAVAVVLHDLGLAGAWCGEILMLDRGRTVAGGPAAAVLTPRNLERVFGVKARAAAGENGRICLEYLED